MIQTVIVDGPLRRGQLNIEVHHVKPVHTLKPGSKVRLTDLVLLCANCHRMAHRRLGALPIQTPNNIFNRIE
ncbi:HNH endonuclease [Sphingomonas sp. ABOLH]|uniref:HNH endonuclease n=1 Tax=Sphingomonas sp. ABOLH TaxID=1985881 RepID=UPI000F7EA538|nr:HNH endonuclease [Sphingomonas sp. ABOLH]RSV14514.1 hypothetical protein CA237_19300 [Sphingomonas sp. ABOLH]